MGKPKKSRKLRLSAKRKIRSAPMWASIKKFGMKRIRTRRIRVEKQKHWRRSKVKE